MYICKYSLFISIRSNCIKSASYVACFSFLIYLEPDYIAMASSWVNYEVPGLSQANEIQQKAVKYAMTRPFSLIQGPPETGKTITAVRIASLFVRLNRELPSSKTGVRPQVMICGPSNKAVDVLAGTFL